MTIHSTLQQTLRHRIGCTGVGLHSGAAVSMVLHPAEADTGIVVLRTDVARSARRIPARWDHVVDTRLCTTIGNAAGTRVGTIEHLLAALYGCGIDNAVVEVNGPEIPIMDGSAAPFVFLIECAGTAVLDAARRYLRVRRTIERSDKRATVSLAPADTLTVRVAIEYDNPLIARQSCAVELRDGAFKNELSRARTFGFAHEVEWLRSQGLARGASLDNAVVVSGESVLNDGGLRFRDEFVRHKALDAVGDLALAGARLVGRFDGWCSGHALNNALLRALFADRSAWTYEIADHDQAAVPAAEWAVGALATA